MRVLVVEDERNLGAAVARGCVRRASSSTWSTTAWTGCHRAGEERYDALVLVTLMPRMSGYDVLRRLRARQVWTPVRMLTARDGDDGPPIGSGQ